MGRVLALGAHDEVLPASDHGNALLLEPVCQRASLPVRRQLDPDFPQCAPARLRFGGLFRLEAFVLRLPLLLCLRQRHVLVLPALLEVVPAMDRHLGLDALLTKQVADDALGLVDRLSAVRVGEEVRSVGADCDGSAEPRLCILDGMLAQARKHVLGDAVLEPRRQSPVFGHAESLPDAAL